MTPTQTLQRLTRRRLVQRDIRIRRIGKQIDRWADRLEDTLLGILRRGRGGPEGVTGHLYVAANEAVDDLVVLFWREFGELFDWAHRSAVDNMVRAVPMGVWVRRIMPVVPMLGVESRGGTVGVLEDFRDEIEVRKILDGQTTDSEARQIVRAIEFPPPSQLRANMIIRHAPWADGLEWPDRVKTRWAVDNRQLASELSQGYSAGENLDQLGTRLRKYSAEDRGINYKCKRLARTEGSRIAEEAQMDIYEQAGDLMEGVAAHNSQDGKVRFRHWRWQRPGAPPTIFYRQPESGMYIAKTGEMAGEPLPHFPADPNCRCFSLPHLAQGLDLEMPPGAIAGQERFQASPEFVLNMPEKEIATRRAAGRVAKKAAAEKVPTAKAWQPAKATAPKPVAERFLTKDGTYDLKGLSADRKDSVLRGIAEVIGDRDVKLTSIGWGKAHKHSLGTYRAIIRGRPGSISFQRSIKTRTKAQQAKTHQSYAKRLEDKAASRQRIAETQRAQGNIRAAESLEESVDDLRTIQRYNSTSDAPDELFAISSHEAGHAVYGQGQVQLPLSGATDSIANQWGGAMNRFKVTRRDILAVSEYAGSNNAELFSEVSSMIAQGRAKVLPSNILAAYRDTMSKWELIP